MVGPDRIPRLPWILLACVALLALIPGGTVDAPSYAQSAAALAPPLTALEEVRLKQDGGFLRARRLRIVDGAIEIDDGTGRRTLTGVSPDGPVSSRRAWLGTDVQGRSVAALVARGAWRSLSIGVVAALVTLVLGSFIGIGQLTAAPWLGRPAGMLVDGLLAVPRLLLMLILALILGGGSLATGWAIGLVGWPDVARISEAEGRRLLAEPFAEAARASGRRSVGLIGRHLLPHLAPLLYRAAPLIVVEAVLVEATLSFLGVGGSTSPSWGRLIADSYALLPGAWWIALAPGILLTLFAMSMVPVAGRRG